MNPLSTDQINLPRFRPYLHGVRIESDFSFGGVDIETGIENSCESILMTLGETPLRLEEADFRSAGFQRKGDEEILLPLEDFGIPVRYWLREKGRKIVCQNLGEGDDATVSNFALFHALPTGLLWRGRDLIFRANAVCGSDQRATLIAGGPGLGKSTLSAFLCQEKNYSPLADDFCVSRKREDSESIEVFAGGQGIKLWPTAIAALGLTCADLPRVRPGVNRFLWRDRGLDRSELSISIRRVLDLRWDRRAETPNLEPLVGAEKIRRLRNCLWNPRRRENMCRNAADDFVQLMDFAAGSEMYSLTRNPLRDPRVDLEYVGKLLG